MMQACQGQIHSFAADHPVAADLHAQRTETGEVTRMPGDLDRLEAALKISWQADP